MFTSYADICNYLNDLGLFHMDLSLCRMEKALDVLNLTTPNFSVVQVVGTNGKGSTVTFLESIARAHGLKTGLFTSPHFISPCERILLNGVHLNTQSWPSLANRIYMAVPELTYFEFLTVLALLAFSENQVDIAIFEAGLGGHYDATSALKRDILCITPISMDHEQILGDTLLSIAEDKAQAMAENMPVFLANQEENVLDFLIKFAHEHNATLHHANQYEGLKLLKGIVNPFQSLSLQGAHQEENTKLALMAWDYIAKLNAWPSKVDKISFGLKNAFIAGRLQNIICKEDSLPSRLLLDGAHNIHSLQILTDYVRKMSHKPSSIIFSCLADKNIQEMTLILQELHLLCDYCPLYITGIQKNNRALSNKEKILLVEQLKINNDAKDSVFISHELHETLSIICENNLLDIAPVLICGSLYLLGEFFQKYPHYLMQSAIDEDKYNE